MKAAASLIDPSILPEQARRELHDFYHFLVGKYAKRHTRPAAQVSESAGALASSPIVGIWKDRDLGDSSVFARSLREKAQKRTSA